MNNSWYKAIGVLASLAALVSSMAAIVRPMQRQIDDLDEDVKALATRLELKAQDKRIERIEEWREWWHKTVPGLDARQNTRLEALEREIRGPP